MIIIRDVICWCLHNATFVAAMVALFVPFIMHYLENRRQRFRQKANCFQALLCNYYTAKPVVNGFVDCHSYAEESYMYFRSMIATNFSCYIAFRVIFFSKKYQKLFDNVDSQLKTVSSKSVNFSEPGFGGWDEFEKLLDSELELLNAVQNKRHRYILFYNLPFSNSSESEVKEYGNQ